MNKKVLSTSLSLACHTIFLIIAFNLVFTPPSMSDVISPPIMIHVHLDYRPFSLSTGNSGQMVPQKNLQPTPPVKAARMNTPQMPLPYQRPVISNENVVTVIRENVPEEHLPPRRKTRKTSRNAREIFKDLKVTNKITTSSIMPITDISNPIQQMQMNPSIDSTMQNYQGESPYLPFDLNGSGTDIKSFLGYDLYTYEDPQDHAKYFKLSIRVEDIPGSLAPLPKEITFLVDASGSIGPRLLKNFKEGIAQSLQELGSDDTFNVMVFNSQLFKMQDSAVSNTQANIQQAGDFLAPFESAGNTDLYDTIVKNVTSIHTMKPAYLFLFSDGQPTDGVTDNLKFINKIDQVNHGSVPIFGFGGGAYNEYFMNFLTFTNHGWAEFDTVGNTVTNITQMYDHIKDPVLTNLRYYSTGLDKNEIYPKRLPDLFKGSEFVLYGRYDHGGDFMFQLRGDAQNDIKQYIVKDNLNNGHPGDRTIAQEWAMRKIFDLIGNLEYDEDNQNTVDEINELAAKFSIKVPKYE